MSKGRKKKPDNVKVVQGTFRDDRSDKEAPPSENELPRSPVWLSAEAREYFGILKERLDSVGLASRTFTEMHALTAQRLADMAELRKAAVESGWEKSMATRYEKAVEHVKALLAELGLSQVSIGKVKPLDDDNNNNKKTGFSGL